MSTFLSKFRFADAASIANAREALNPDRPAAFAVLGPPASGKTRLVTRCLVNVFGGSWPAAHSSMSSQRRSCAIASDMNAMKWADTFVLVLPCGRSAHLELGWACGQGKQTLILTRDGEEPELMAKMCDHICVSLDEVRQILAG